MAENPLTGVGAAGFWRSESGLANQITTFFFYTTYVKFSFHNSYLENGVQLGYPGYYATFFLVGWGLSNIVRTWLKNQTLLQCGDDDPGDHGGHPLECRDRLRAGARGHRHPVLHRRHAHREATTSEPSPFPYLKRR